MSERGIHPGAWTYQNSANMRAELKRRGLSIEWARIEARARDAGVVPEFVRDHLLFEAHYDRTAWERWKDRVTDYRMWVGRKQ